MRIQLISVSIALLAACSATNNDSPSGGGSGGGSGGATADEIASCHNDCDQMKFFGCNSAADQSSCYDDCGTATPTQISTFDGCARTSICDPSCRNDITPPPPDGGTATGTGASAASCASACQKLVSCSEITLGEESACESQCEMSAYQYQITCIANTDCSKLESQCGAAPNGGGDGDSGIVVVVDDGGSSTTDASQSATNFIPCDDACDALQSNTCISQSDDTLCRDLCFSKTQAQDDAFTSCVAGASSDCNAASSCYSALQK